MKKILMLVVGLAVASSDLVAQETYVCSQSLDRFGQPGRVETLVLKRIGDSFRQTNARWLREFPVYDIAYESESELILTQIMTGSPSRIGSSITVIMIHKDTLEWGMDFVSMRYLREPNANESYGECVLVE